MPNKTVRVLFIGDVVGEPGRRIIARSLPDVVSRNSIDCVIANVENAAGGFGITPKIADELFALGINVMTGGNHLWDKKEILGYLEKERRLLRGANYPDGVPGAGSLLWEVPSHVTVGVLHLIGRVFMAPLDCPFRVGRREVESLRTHTPIIVVDFHAEATSEKMAIGWYLAGSVSAVIGTHTHIQTADERILPGGTAYITDVGMTGPTESVIGIRREIALERFLTQTPKRLETASGPSRLSAVMIEIDSVEGRALSIQRMAMSEE